MLNNHLCLLEVTRSGTTNRGGGSAHAATMCRSQSSPPASDLLWRVPGLRSMLFWFSSRVVFVLQAVHLLYSQHICCSKNRKQKIFHYVILLHTTGIMMTHSQPNILQYYSIYRYNTYFHYSEFFLRVCYYRLLKMSESWLCNITFRQVRRLKCNMNYFTWHYKYVFWSSSLSVTPNV